MPDCDPAKAIAKYGDVDFLRYGGELLMPSSPNPVLEVVIPPCGDFLKAGDWTPDAQWHIYRVEVKRYTVALQDLHAHVVPVAYKPQWGPASHYEEWFGSAADIEAVANSVGREVSNLLALLVSRGVKKRAHAFIDLGTHWGWDNFDAYPLVLSEHEVHLRYGMRDDCRCEWCAEPLE